MSRAESEAPTILRSTFTAGRAHRVQNAKSRGFRDSLEEATRTIKREDGRKRAPCNVKLS